MIEKLKELVKVETFIERVKCPNPECETGVLEHDGKTRTENGVHGGALQFRHRCAECNAGYWLGETFPKVKHVSVEAAPTVKMPVRKGKEAEKVSGDALVGQSNIE